MKERNEKANILERKIDRSFSEAPKSFTLSIRKYFFNFVIADYLSCKDDTATYVSLLHSGAYVLYYHLPSYSLFFTNCISFSKFLLLD